MPDPGRGVMSKRNVAGDLFSSLGAYCVSAGAVELELITGCRQRVGSFDDDGAGRSCGVAGAVDRDVVDGVCGHRRRVDRGDGWHGKRAGLDVTDMGRGLLRLGWEAVGRIRLWSDVVAGRRWALRSQR